MQITKVIVTILNVFMVLMMLLCARKLKWISKKDYASFIGFLFMTFLYIANIYVAWR